MNRTVWLKTAVVIGIFISACNDGGGVGNNSTDVDSSDGDTDTDTDNDIDTDVDTDTDGDSDTDTDADTDADSEPFPECGTPSTLKEAGDCTGRLIGAALNSSLLSNGSYVNAAKEHNYITAENEMKWDRIEPESNRFDFQSADQIAKFAQDNGMKLKGHTLVWYNQLPQWVQFLGTEDAVRQAMTNHIQKVMQHYSGKMEAWDVVNEAVQTDSDSGDGNPKLRSNVFLQKLGDTYIDEAFQIAHEADPNAKLYYNDYSIEAMNDKSNAVYELLARLVADGVPIDGVGMQTHIGTPNDYPPTSEIAENMARFAALGLEIVLSEMDVHICGGKTAEWQRQTYHDVVAACVAEPACVAITFWGISDGNSWLNMFDRTGCNGTQPQPLLWNNNYQKKDTYDAVMEALTGN